MEARMALTWVLILCVSIIPAHCEYYSQNVPYEPIKEKRTHFHFFLHDIISGKNPSAVMVAHANLTQGDKSPTPFGTVFAIDDLLTEGPELTSKVIGNARGLYVSSGQDTLSLVLYVDFGFTTGRFNGSSISVFSRNPVMETRRELAVVGGRGRLRMARGYARLKTHYLNTTNGDAIIEYKVVVYHH